jgi:non-specific protein-tyrosine kinase
MDLGEYLLIIKRRFWIILLTLIVAVGVVLVITEYTIPEYQATTTMRVATSSGGNVSYTDNQYADRMLNTYVNIATTKPVLDELKKRTGLASLPDISTQVVPNTELIRINVVSPNPQTASEVANTLASILSDMSLSISSGGTRPSQEILLDQLKAVEVELTAAKEEYDKLVANSPGDTVRIEAASNKVELKQKIYGTLTEQYEQARVRELLRANTISVIDPAVIPLIPIRPRPIINLTLAVAVGLVGGLGLAFLFDYLDNTIKTSQEIEHITGLPVLGNIPKTRRKFLFALSETRNVPLTDSIRRLRVNLIARTRTNSARTVLVTSPNPNEGKSVIVVNLASSFAHANARVIIVDCDLHVPSIHRYLKLPNETGLSNVLMAGTALEEVIQETSIPGLSVLSSGLPFTEPTEYLPVEIMAEVIHKLQGLYDVVLIDTPALLALSDAMVLAPLDADVVLVVSRGRTHKQDIIQTQRQLLSVKANLVGVIENYSKQRYNRYYYYKRASKSFNN